jgi:hypothetical protein
VAPYTWHIVQDVISQTLIPLDSHFEVDHHYQIFGVLPNSFL